MNLSKIVVIRGQGAKTIAELKSTVTSTGNRFPDMWYVLIYA
jgi:hypothetical protein